MSRSSHLIDLALHLHFETSPGNPDAGAILVSETGDKSKAVWLPKSWIEVEDQKTHIVVTLPEQLAQQKGLI